jgi:ArsR family transcriptional regulator
VRRHTSATAPAPDDCVATVRTPALSRRQAEDLAVLLKAVADPVRLRIVSLIGASDSGELIVGDLVERIGLSQPTVSHHLRVLTEAGLLSRERRASFVWYRVQPAALDRLRSFLE